MKLQLLLLSVILASALALPVPDEEVSPVQLVSVPEAQPEVVPKQEEKPVEVVKPESRAAEEKAPERPIEEPKLELPEKAPDAELPQKLPEKIKEDLKTEKQIRADSEAGEVKALPVVNTPVAGVEVSQQVVEEVVPAVQEVQPEGKSANLLDGAVEEPEKIEQPAPESEVKVLPETPALAIPEPVLEEAKKEEIPARQERVNQENVVEEQVVPQVVVAEVVESEVVQPVVKSLLPEASLKSEETQSSEIELKSAAPAPAPLETAEKKEEQLQQSIGEIAQPEQTAESAVKSLSVEQPEQLPGAEQPAVQEAAPVAPILEGKRIEEPIVAEPKQISPAAVEQPQQPIANAEEQQPESLAVKTLAEEKPLISEQSSSESSSKEEEKKEESKESAESKESEESIEKKSN